MARWGMVIDLRKCLGCESCSIACGIANKVPKNSWRQVIDCGVRQAPDRQRILLSLGCQQCREAPCLQVCPTGATVRRSDGIVDIDEERCVGCGYCIVACPYRARTLLRRGYGFEFKGTPESPEKEPSLHDYSGVCSKCTFCREHVEAGLERGLKPGIDPEATPVCVNSCCAAALHFGDLDDPDSDVSGLIRDNETVRLREDLKTEPAVAFIVPEGWTGLPEKENKE